MKSKQIGWVVPLSVFLGGIGGGIVFPILPILGLQFGLSAAFIGFILSANRIARILSNQFVGFSIDKFGGRKPLITGLIIESAGSILYVYSLYSHLHGIIMLIGRLVWGVGSAFVFISANTIALNLSVRSTRGRSTAKVRIALSLGVPAGLVLGGILAGIFSDSVAFASSAAASFLGAALVYFIFEETQISSRASITLKESFLYAFKDKTVLLIGVYNMLTFFSLQGVVMATLVLFVKAKSLHFIYPDPRFSSGVIMSFMMVSSGISGIIAGRTVDKLKYRSIIGFPCAVLVILGFILLAESQTSLGVIIALLMLGSGIGINNVTLLSILGDITNENRGISVSVYQLLGDIGGMLGPICGVQFGVILGFSNVYLITAAIFSTSLIILFYLYKKEKQKG